MIFMRVLVVESLCQAVMGWFLALECWCQAHVGASGYARSCLTLNDRVGRGYWLPGDVTWGPRCLLSREKKGQV
jgi:hypothetical protein